MNSYKSYIITGSGGSGKALLLKLLQAELRNQDKDSITLCPANLAALLVGGMTIDKYSTNLKNNHE
jgi:ABC-type lipoprotein export system ATPase subunit